VCINTFAGTNLGTRLGTNVVVGAALRGRPPFAVRKNIFFKPSQIFALGIAIARTFVR